MCTEFQKKIYNEHLKRSRLAKKQPFRIRKNFQDVNDSVKLYLSRLESFFTNNPNIKISDYFNAPYIIYGENEYFDLKFFCSQKSISVYSLYIKNLMESNPDEIMDRLISGVKFIDNFCKENNITINEYAFHTTGFYPTFILHLKNFIYPLYFIFYIPNAELNFRKLSDDEKNFLFSNNVYDNLDILNKKIKNSLNANRLLEAWIKNKLTYTVEKIIHMVTASEYR